MTVFSISNGNFNLTIGETKRRLKITVKALSKIRIMGDKLIR